MDVSIIIVNYKTPKLCVDCIHSVFEKTYGLVYEIIIVDNNSCDNSIDILKKEFGSQIKIIKSNSNLGFGKANNLGAEGANGKYLFLLNSDTLLKNNAIKILYDFIDKNRDVGIVGANLFDKNNKPTHSFKFNQIDQEGLKVYGLLKTVSFKLKRNPLEWEFNDSGNPLEIHGYITGADLMIKKSIFNEVGGFDKDFFMYFEESEMTYRVKQLGYKIFSVPDAQIIHLEGASTKTKFFSDKRQRMFNESAVIFFRKVYGENSVESCYKILISNCRKIAFRKFLQFNFDAVKKLNKEKSLLKEELKQYKMGG